MMMTLIFVSFASATGGDNMTMEEKHELNSIFGATVMELIIKK